MEPPPPSFFYSPLRVNNQGDMTGFIIQVINYTQVAINEYQRNWKEFPPFSGYGVIHDNMKGQIYKVRMFSYHDEGKFKT